MPIRLEAEDLSLLSGYQVESGVSVASGSALIRNLGPSGSTAIATTQFTGVSGSYRVSVGFFDESDGNGTISIDIGNQQFDLFLNVNPGGNRAQANNYFERVLADELTLNTNDIIEIAGTRDNGELARFDYIEFDPITPVSSNPDPVDPVTPPPTQDLFIEAEDMALSSTYQIESRTIASGNQLISLYNPNGSVPGETGTASFTFGGRSGRYDITIAYFDESDGVGEIEVDIGGDTVDRWILNESSGRAAVPNANSFRTRTISSQDLTNGELVTLRGTASDPEGEWGRIDYVEIRPADSVDPVDPVDPVGPFVRFDRATSGVTVDLSARTANYQFGAIPGEEMKVLALGDSNTRAFPHRATNGGYRTELYRDLDANGFNVDFLGTSQHGPSDIDRDHEGRGGFTIDELSNGGGPNFNGSGPRYIDIEAAVSGDPHSVLLMAGTNDILQGDSVGNMLRELRHLIDRIDAASPHTNVLLSSIIPNTSTTARENTTAHFNSRILAEVVRPSVATGKQVTFVDMFNATRSLERELLSDGIHLTSRGYRQMADVWYDALTDSDVTNGISGAALNVLGSDFNDTLIGNGSSNVLNGGNGHDTLTGRGGSDIFVLSENAGTDRITDFTIGTDLIDLLQKRFVVVW